MQKGGVLKDEEGNLVAKEGGKMYKNGGRRKKTKKKASTTFLERTFYGRKKAAADRRRKTDRMVSNVKAGKPVSETVIIAADPKDEAKLQRKKMRLDEVIRRRKNRGVAARKPGKGLGARRARRLGKKVAELKVDDRQKFAEDLKERREASKKKVRPPGGFGKRK